MLSKLNNTMGSARNSPTSSQKYPAFRRDPKGIVKRVAGNQVERTEEDEDNKQHLDHAAAIIAQFVEKRFIDYKAVNFWNVGPEWETSALCRSGVRFAVVQDEGSGLLWAVATA